MKLLGSLMIIILAITIVLLLIVTSDADAHYKPGRHNAIHAIQKAFCGKAHRSCREGKEAVEVVECEAAQYWDQDRPQEAKNGQYEGMFQMGTEERKKWGHGPDPWKQAIAAFRYYVASGRDWSPWDPRCQP
jgi:hypothetical protein